MSEIVSAFQSKSGGFASPTMQKMWSLNLACRSIKARKAVNSSCEWSKSLSVGLYQLLTTMSFFKSAQLTVAATISAVV